jgi:hypothetical protein
VTRTCIFCDSSLSKSTRSKEDVIPRWVRELVQLPSGVRVRVERRYEGQPLPNRLEDTLVLIARNRVCRTCNNTWMSRMQEAAKPSIGAMIGGHPKIVLMPDAQAVISGWLTMLAMVLEADTETVNPYYTDKERERLRTVPEVPGLTTVWLARRSASDSRLGAFGSSYSIPFLAPENPPKIAPGFVMTICIGHAVFQMLVIRSDRRSLEYDDGVWADAIVRFGPPNAPLPWPPPRPLDDLGLHAFAVRWNRP